MSIAKSEELNDLKRPFLGTDFLTLETIEFFKNSRYINPTTLEPNLLLSSAFKILGDEIFATGLTYQELCVKIIAELHKKMHETAFSYSGIFVEMLDGTREDDDFLDLAGSIIVKLISKPHPDLVALDEIRYEEWDM